MTIAHRRTWQFSLKNSVSSPNLFDKVLIGIKDAMKAFVLNPWTVKGSSNGSTGAMDNLDRWTWGVLLGSEAWIVLYQSALGLHMCLQRSTPAPSVHFSYVGFTGGTATARPTAADEWGKNLNTLTNVFNNPVIYNVAGSTDGKNLIAWTSSAPDATLTTWLIGEAAEPASGWSKPHYAHFSTVSGHPATASLIGVNAGTNSEIITALLPGEPAIYTAATRIWCMTDLVGGTAVNIACTGVNPTTGKPTILGEFRLGVHAIAAKGVLGVLPDVRPVCGGAQNDLMDSRRWIRHGDIVLPWDGATAYP